MVRENDLRQGETTLDWPEPPDAGIRFIGRIRTPWTSRVGCPRQGRLDGPICRIELDERLVEGLAGLEAFEQIEVLYWLHHSRRDLLRQSPRDDGQTRGTFALRSPIRPNPIGTSIVRLERIAGHVLEVRGLDCLDGTPLIDLKPDRCLFSPVALPTPGDADVGTA